ncbi:MAG: hypothetical protein OXP37_05310 [Chloroflexota bacterium]|nr:hypothetical protein [Chloroflexota bacterium]MDE2936240.1 hypothetical protein [Chloroflexota bacterium]
MIGNDGVTDGAAKVVVDGNGHTAPVSNGVAVIRSSGWGLDLQGRIPITVTNAESASHIHFQTLVAGRTRSDYLQHQFIVVDSDFDGVEGQFAVQVELI